MTDFHALIPAGLPVAPPEDPTCSKCEQLRRTDVECLSGWIEVPSTDPRYNPSMARCRQWEARLKATSQAAGMTAAGLDDAKYQGDFDDLTLEHRSWQAALVTAGKIREVVTQGLNIVARGPTGTGKTHASVLICRAAQREGYTTLKLDWSRFLDGIRDGYNDRTQEPEGKKFDRVCAVDVLMLDDIAAGGEDNKFSVTRLEKIITRRYDAQKPTILTANLMASHLNELLGDRSASRIQGRVIELVFDGPKYREQVERRAVRSLVESIWKDVSR